MALQSTRLERLLTAALLAWSKKESIGSNCVSASPSVRNICCQLQVTGGGVISSEIEPTIQIAFPIGGGAVGATTATKTAERESWKSDNRKKLGAATTAERHLVVYLDAGNGLPWTALTSFAPPPITPNIPDEVTHLWLIGHADGANEFIIWRAGTNQPWRGIKITVPAEHNKEPATEHVNIDRVEISRMALEDRSSTERSRVPCL